jgi:hypothetical protein
VVKRVYVVLSAFGLVLAACGGTSTDTTASANAQDSQTTVSTTSTTVTPAEESSGVDLGEDGELTLEDFIPGANTNYEEIDWRAQELEVQQSVAICMAAEGFEYVPFVPSDIDGGFIEEEWDEETYVKEYGFGVASWVTDERNFGVTEEGDEFEDPYANDPNMAIVEAMDEFEREEYHRVLHGSEPAIIEDTPWEEIEAMTQEEQEAFWDEAYADWEPDGCFNEAYEDAYSEESAEAFYEEFSEDLEAIYEQVESDSRILAAQAEWSSCMADKGHTYATQEEMYGYFYGDEFGEGEFSKQVNELITWPEYDDTVELTEEEMNDPKRWMPQYDIELLQPYIDEEIAVGTANYECSKDSYELWEEVYNDLQQDFLDENMDRLLAFLEANS